MTPTFSSVFTGGNLAGIGATMAGFQDIWGVELDPRIAEVGRANGCPGMVVGDILNMDVRRFDRPDWFHASLVCTRASVANNSAELNEDGLKESPLDIAMAEKTAEFIRFLRPPRVTIENVRGYKRFKSFALLIRALADCGYMYDQAVYNCADFGVPQSRHRLLVRGVLGGLLPHMPAPVNHIGWYAAIEDILDTLPESQFAEWQLARLPDFLGDATLFHPQKRGENLIFATQEAPSNTITASRNMRQVRAFLMPGGGNTNFDEAYPGRGVLFEEQPSHVITTQQGGGAFPKAFIVDGQNSGREISVRSNCEHRLTIGAENKGAYRAFLVDGKPLNYAGDLNIIATPTPTPTLTASIEKHPFRAWLKQGHVVKMTTQALGRFQTLPDSYQGATPQIVGNGCPCLWFKEVGSVWYE